MADKTEQKKAWVRIVSKAWADEVYKQRLLNNPAAVLAEEGFKVPEGVNVEVFEQAKPMRTSCCPSHLRLLILPSWRNDWRLERARVFFSVMLGGIRLEADENAFNPCLGRAHVTVF
ncbi:NHLP leader peptide family RiPP precursor [Maridesulfovibrio sp.]|uniref:NHLP leader peptide family RiPP precursor n=1 Tax=Maridesulfovibrio sp. TaxID=2795000 RepID=UPI0039EEE5E3